MDTFLKMSESSSETTANNGRSYEVSAYSSQ